MADVLIVCVREDESQAKALADMFERAGFTVGGAPTGDAPLRTSGAAVVVWSQASIRSRPFLDAAQRVVNAGKGVVACLIEPPPPASINNSPAFDLTRWNGDSDDAALDPLFFAVDRMVNSARAAVGAAPAQPVGPGYEPPPPRPAPPPQRPPAAAPPYMRAAPPLAVAPPGFQTRTRAPAPPPAAHDHAPRGPSHQGPSHQGHAPHGHASHGHHYGAAAPRQSQPASDPTHDAIGQDPLGSEAEHWRAIRNSKDAGDFLDYLARYGANGAFSELADLRLKQLQQPPPAAQLREAARASNVEPLRRHAPAREPAHHAPPERARGASVERLSDHYRDPPVYDPPPVTPKSGGGGVRAFLFLLVLFGAALGGGMYLGLWQLPQPESAEVEDVTPTPPVGEPADAAPETPALADEGQPAIGGPTAAEEQSFDQGLRSAPAQAEEAGPGPTRLAARPEPRPAPIPDPTDTFTPAPVRSWDQSTRPSGGPVPLLPPAQEASIPPLPDPRPQPHSAPSRATAAPVQVIWAQRPSGDTLASLYPARAERERIEGRVVLDCTVGASLAVACAVSSETPAGTGFAAAALSAANRFRARATLADGRSAIGARTRVALVFRAPAN